MKEERLKEENTVLRFMFYVLREVKGWIPAFVGMTWWGERKKESIRIYVLGIT
jgi:hypothetical protein